MEPGEEIGCSIGAMDGSFTMSAHLRTNGDYVVLLQNYINPNITYYVWNPKATNGEVINGVDVVFEAEAYSIDSDGETPDVNSGIRSVDSSGASASAKVGYTSDGAWVMYPNVISAPGPILWKFTHPVLPAAAASPSMWILRVVRKSAVWILLLPATGIPMKRLPEARTMQ